MRLSSAWFGIWLAVLLCLTRDAVAMSHRRRGELKSQVREVGFIPLRLTPSGVSSAINVY